MVAFPQTASCNGAHRAETAAQCGCVAGQLPAHDPAAGRLTCGHRGHGAARPPAHVTWRPHHTLSVVLFKAHASTCTCIMQGTPQARRCTVAHGRTMRMATALSRSPRSLMLCAKAFSASLLFPICVSTTGAAWATDAHHGKHANCNTNTDAVVANCAGGPAMKAVQTPKRLRQPLRQRRSTPLCALWPDWTRRP
jgi:hypothetical protein